MHDNQPRSHSHRLKPGLFGGGLLLALVSVALVSGNLVAATLPYPAYLPLAMNGVGPTAMPGLTAQATATFTNTPTSTPTNTPTNTPTATPTSTSTTTAVRVAGSIALAPRQRIVTTNTQPTQYLVLLDATGSMSYSRTGAGTYGGAVVREGDTIGGTDYRCISTSSSTLPYFDNCQGGANAPWRYFKERRIYQAKAFVNRLIDKLDQRDTMRLIPFTMRIAPDNYEVLPANGWTGDKQLLRDTLLGAGSYNGDPYRTQGGSSNAQAMRGAKAVWDAAPTSAFNGQPYRQVMVVIADGPANIFLDGIGNTARDICPQLSPNAALGTITCQIGYSSSSQQLRPVTAMLDQAQQIKNNHLAMTVYAIEAGDTDTGMRDVASSPSLYFTQMNDAIIDNLVPPVVSSCVPSEGASFVTSIDAAHLPVFPPQQALPENVYGTVTLFDSNRQQLAQAPIIHNAVTGMLSYDFGLLPLGSYFVTASSWYRGDDGVTRAYTKLSMGLVNPQDELEFSVVASPDNTLVMPTLSLTLDSAINVCAP